MSENHIADVAKILGVELGEKFDLIKHDVDMDNPYYLTEQGLFDNKNKICPSFMISEIIFGHLEIIKKPWKPQTDDKYYYIEATLDCNHIDVWQEIWKNTTVDMERYAVGNFFKTREEASNSVNAYCKYLNNVVADLSWHNSK